MDPTNNPFILDLIGDSSHVDYPGQKIFVKRLVCFGGPLDGNVNLLDHDGVLREETGTRHGAEPQNQKDPRIILNGQVAADSRTEIVVNAYVRGLFLDDIPAGGKVEVYHGVE